MHDPRPHGVLCTIGTRPEAIKMAPVILKIQHSPWAQCRVLLTGQHCDLVNDALRPFGIRGDIDLEVMRTNQSLPELTARLITRLDAVLADESPEVVLAQGDTTTVLCTALACFYRKIPFGHVEAGLRTGKKYYPFPEEMNRVLVSRIADLHFAPTQEARQNLVREGVPDSTITVTGNTSIDALLWMARQNPSLSVDVPATGRLILVTAHRRENFGTPFARVFQALRRLADSFSDVFLLYPVHPNPNVKGPAEAALGGHPRIRLCAPLDYRAFIAAMQQAYFIVTDSGGVQEEAPALGKPVLVLREETERPEAVSMGAVRLVGSDPERILQEASRLLTDPEAYAKMAKPVFPYGDGTAAVRIAGVLERYLSQVGPGRPGALG